MEQRTAAPGNQGEISQVINVTNACNQRCIFCSRVKSLGPYKPVHIREAVRRFKDSLCFEGGEPTLFRDILKWIRYAREEGVREIILVTNGYSLDNPSEARKYLQAGITLFNVNLPAHTPAAYDALTQTCGNFAARVKAVRTLIRVAGGHRVRVTLVATSLIMPNLPDYVRFILREFPNLRYLEINFPKRLGNCVTRPWLIPTLAESRKPLLSALELLKAGSMQVITDGFPLCIMKGFEHCSIDAHVLFYEERHHSFLREKIHCPPCARCSLAGICMGPRKDYVSRRDWSELRPSRVLPALVTAKIEKKRRSALAGPANERESGRSRLQRARKAVHGGRKLSPEPRPRALSPLDPPGVI